jgi:hypothetical protein
MLEKERDWKRVVRILAEGNKVDWRSCVVLSVRVGSVVRDDMIDEGKVGMGAKVSSPWKS